MSAPKEAQGLIGPMFSPAEWYEVEVRGCRVPRLVVERQADGLYTVVLDRRFCIPDRTGEELNWWLPMVADAMALGAGYPCMGATERYSEYGCKVMNVTSVVTEPAAHARLSLVSPTAPAPASPATEEK